MCQTFCNKTLYNQSGKEGKDLVKTLLSRSLPTFIKHNQIVISTGKEVNTLSCARVCEKTFYTLSYYSYTASKCNSNINTIYKIISHVSKGIYPIYGLYFACAAMLSACAWCLPRSLLLLQGLYLNAIKGYRG